MPYRVLLLLEQGIEDDRRERRAAAIKSIQGKGGMPVIDLGRFL